MSKRACGCGVHFSRVLEQNKILLPPKNMTTWHFKPSVFFFKGLNSLQILSALRKTGTTVLTVKITGQKIMLKIV
jgi:hypothetical protein